MNFQEYLKQLTDKEYLSKAPYKEGGEFSGYYRRRTEKIVKHIRSYLGESFFKDKTLLDVGCGHGHMGAGFQDLCSKVTCSDGRKSNVEQGKLIYPEVEFVLADVEKEWPFGKFDIILNLGLLYHVSNPADVIAKCADSCQSMILDCVIEAGGLNSIVLKDESSERYDCAVSGKACIVSQTYLESALKESNFRFRRPDIENKACNYDGKTRYDWTDNPTHGCRRLWFCEKNSQ